MDPWVMNRPEAALPDTPVPPHTVLISITEPGRKAALPDQFVTCAAILRQEFDDLDSRHQGSTGPIVGASRNPKWFNVGQAREMAAFLTEHRGKNIIVHCAAGVSRSGAVVETILEAFPEYSDEGWPRHPNGHVRSFLKRALGLVPLGAQAFPAEVA
jgi:predicted protein tyrosine phosphatase